ncbi:hypothetical protein [Simiduia litorea]
MPIYKNLPIHGESPPSRMERVFKGNSMMAQSKFKDDDRVTSLHLPVFRY